MCAHALGIVDPIAGARDLAAADTLNRMAQRATMVIAMAIVALCVALLAPGVCLAAARADDGAQAEPPSQQTERAAETGRNVELAPGVRIDWKNLTVELEAAIVLRRGPLELLACSPRTREHESILVVRGRPMKMFQAMGLIGLEPGSPVRFDEKAQKWLAPTGTALDLRVRFKRDGRTTTVDVRRWLLDIERNKPPEGLGWVFSGSRTLESGRFAADLDGTVICVVDFDAALIAVSATHSADNAQLWLGANTDEIPPIGTPCTLLITKTDADTGVLVVHLATDGVLTVGSMKVGAGDVAKRCRRSDGRPRRVLLTTGRTTPPDVVRASIASLVGAGIERARIVVRRIPAFAPKHKIAPTPPAREPA